MDHNKDKFYSFKFKLLLLKNVNWKEKYFYLLKMREYEAGVRLCLSLSTWRLEGSGLGGLAPPPPRMKEGEKFVLNLLLLERKVE